MSQPARLLQFFLFTGRIWRSIAAINHGWFQEVSTSSQNKKAVVT
jgi:hypothetical protein